MKEFDNGSILMGGMIKIQDIANALSATKNNVIKKGHTAQYIARCYNVVFTYSTAVEGEATYANPDQADVLLMLGKCKERSAESTAQIW